MAKVTDEQLREAVDALAEHGTKTGASRALGVPVTTLRGRLRMAEDKGLVADKQQGDAKGERFKYSEHGDVAELESVAHDVRTLDDALAKAEVDAAVWEVERFTVNAWEVFGGEIGRQPLWQVKVWLKRRVSKPWADAIAALTDRVAKHSPKYPKVKYKRSDDPHMLEVSPFDAHFGKLGWAKEVGHDYDLDIAEKLYLNAFDDLLGKVAGFSIDKILIPVGQDFMHVDNPQGTTPKSGNVLDVDSRLHKIFETACMAVVKGVERCLMVAPVELVWVPGNHDPESSWYILQFLRAWFRNTKDVTVEQDHRSRKYRTYGVNLIGYTHGDEEPHRDLPTIMAGEVPQLWAASKHREWHLGHFHKRKETRHVSGDTFGPVVVRVLPSLSGTDAWHFSKGYVNGVRAAEAYLYSKKNGYTGHVSADARIADAV